jgi:hypothetical protein
MTNISALTRQETLLNRLKLKAVNLNNNRRLLELSRQVLRHAHIEAGQQPVAFFNASTRLDGISQNAAFAFLAACGVQLAGVPVAYFSCHAGMSRCVLGTNKDDHTAAPPCEACVRQSRWLYGNALEMAFTYQADHELTRDLEKRTLDELAGFSMPFPNSSEPVPLGQMVIPGLRWALRRHNLKDDPATRFLLREYILSAARVAREFDRFLDQIQPQSVVLFNGIMFPEAAARWVAWQRGLRVITHEVGLQPLTCFFTNGDATAYPIEIPPDFELSPSQNARLDAYLEQRFQGKFTMAGIRFWPEMSGLDQDFLDHLAQFRQMVPVFSNVIFDTSQIHANTVFRDMFAWLELVHELARQHPDTLFVVRAHPDEMRPGKESRESVEGWMAASEMEKLPNVVFFKSNHYISSYELIRRAKFVMVYNSSIGLEAALMGAAVLNGGKARYTQLPTVFFPAARETYFQQAEEFLSADLVTVPEMMRWNARKFLYFQLFRTSLPFGEFLKSHPNPTRVSLRDFTWTQLAPESSPTLRVVTEGILENKPFLLEEL